MTEVMAPALKAGSTVLGHSIVGLLAQGAMSEVYLARKVGAPGAPPVVVKRMRPGLLADAEALQMFQEEARLAALLRHPNIVQTQQVGSVASDHLLVMEYLNGRTLLSVARACFERRAYLPFELTVRILADCLSALDHAHHLRGPHGEPLDVVHRAFIPEHVFVTYDGMVKVVDFGIGKASVQWAMASAGTGKSRLGYLSPEALAGEKVDGRSDLFSVGVVLYELLTYSVPFPGQVDAEVMAAVQRKDPRPPRSINPAAPPPLEEICLKALEKNRAHRWQDAGEMREALLGFVRGAGRTPSLASLGAFMEALFPIATDTDRQHVARLMSIPEHAAVVQAAHSSPSNPPVGPAPAPLPAPGLAAVFAKPVPEERDGCTVATPDPPSFEADVPAAAAVVTKQVPEERDGKTVATPGVPEGLVDAPVPPVVLPKRAPEEREDRTEVVKEGQVPSELEDTTGEEHAESTRILASAELVELLGSTSSGRRAQATLPADEDEPHPATVVMPVPTGDLVFGEHEESTRVVDSMALMSLVAISTAPSDPVLQPASDPGAKPVVLSSPEMPAHATPFDPTGEEMQELASLEDEPAAEPEGPAADDDPTLDTEEQDLPPVPQASGFTTLQAVGIGGLAAMVVVLGLALYLVVTGQMGSGSQVPVQPSAPAPAASP